jgi:hypothetical protein
MIASSAGLPLVSVESAMTRGAFRKASVMDHSNPWWDLGLTENRHRQMRTIFWWR